MAEILTALQKAKQEQGRPNVIIARTVKGKGVSFMEDVGKWHSGPPSEAEYLAALADLGCGEAANG